MRKKKVTKEMELSLSQQLALSKFIRGENVFMSGSGGTGKSVVIRHMYAVGTWVLHKRVSVCAMTGIAASLLEECGDARTVHAWAGIGVGTKPVEQLIAAIRARPAAVKVWRDTQVLIVDEVSMMCQSLFEKLDAIGCALRGSTLPFGGIQVVLVGDFFQLPPVFRQDAAVREVAEEDGLAQQMGGEEFSAEETVRRVEARRAFCFASPRWRAAFAPENHVVFTHIFRQTDDRMRAALEQIRRGLVEEETIALMESRVQPRDALFGGVIRPPHIYPRKDSVHCENGVQFDRLSTPVVVFSAERHFAGGADVPRMRQETMLTQMIQAVFPDDDLRLRVGAQVMCVVNRPQQGISNGSQGVVESFVGGLPVVKFASSSASLQIAPHEWSHPTVAGLAFTQIPLILAWAVTVHKAQGITMDCACIDAGPANFESGQIYVSLSRVRTLDGLFLQAFSPDRIRASPDVVAFYRALPPPPPTVDADALALVSRHIAEAAATHRHRARPTPSSAFHHHKRPHKHSSSSSTDKSVIVVHRHPPKWRGST